MKMMQAKLKYENPSNIKKIYPYHIENPKLIINRKEKTKKQCKQNWEIPKMITKQKNIWK